MQVASVSAALAVLQEADRLLEGWECPTCTAATGSANCCRFALTGREPWLTEAEWRVIREELQRAKRSLPPLREDGACPFLDAASRCTIYEVRPLGCRTFFCDEASGPGFPRREISRLPRDLEALSAKPTRDDDGRARPLTTWVKLAKRR